MQSTMAQRSSVFEMDPIPTNEYNPHQYVRASSYDDMRSMRPSETYAPSRNTLDGKGEKFAMREYDQVQPVRAEKPSAGRRRWVALTWIFTWWIPSYFLEKCGGMKRSDVRMAWREKLLIK